MERFWKHWHIGRRWLWHGWQLYRRNPWMLSGMGLTATLVLAVLHTIPLIGGLLTALLAPLMLASAYLSLDPLYRSPMRLPAALWLPALKHSPRQLLCLFRSETRILPTVVAGVLSVCAVLLVHLFIHILGGQAWVSDWSYLDAPSLLGVLALALVAATLYVVLAAALIYALPLVLLRDEALVPALRLSLKASRHFTIALLVLLGVALLPFGFGVLAALWSPWIGYVAWIMSGALVYPIVASSLYCSYHDIFSARDSWQPVDRRRHTDHTGPEEESLRPL